MEIPFSNGAIQLLAYMATRKFGGSDGVFNSAGFSHAMFDACGFHLDGNIVAAILADRPGIQRLNGGCHWQLKLDLAKLDEVRDGPTSNTH